MSLEADKIYYNSPAGVLYNQALRYEAGTAIVDSGALAVKNGKKTEGRGLPRADARQPRRGRFPQDLRDYVSGELG
jgi:hypothetical protein